MKRFLILVSIVFSVNLIAQEVLNQPFGKGLLNFQAQDQSWNIKLTTRIQSRYEGNLDTESAFYSDRFYIRRARIKASGFVYSPKIKYKFEYDMVNGQVLDAVIKWNFAGNWVLWFGQTKLPGNLERMFSSQKMQFVDRSLLNSQFTLDRDAGFQLRHHFFIGEKFLIREILAFSQGEGLNQYVMSEGHSYTARIELLPFGEFSSKGDYFASDLKREKTPKLMIAFVYDFNHKAMRSRGQKGDYISNPNDLRNLRSLFIDAHFKYQGLSFLGEYTNRTTNANPNVTPLYDNGVLIPGDYTYYVGSGLNMQAGYLFKNNWEVAGRYTIVNPDSETNYNTISQYMLGLSKYVVGHNLKVQADFGLTHEDTKDHQICFRLQTELAF